MNKKIELINVALERLDTQIESAKLHCVYWLSVVQLKHDDYDYSMSVASKQADFVRQYTKAKLDLLNKKEELIKNS